MLQDDRATVPRVDPYFSSPFAMTILCFHFARPEIAEVLLLQLSRRHFLFGLLVDHGACIGMQSCSERPKCQRHPAAKHIAAQTNSYSKVRFGVSGCYDFAPHLHCV